MSGSLGHLIYLRSAQLWIKKDSDIVFQANCFFFDNLFEKYLTLFAVAHNAEKKTHFPSWLSVQEEKGPS